MQCSTSVRVRRLFLLGAVAAGSLLSAGGCGGSNSGTVVPDSPEHGKKNKDMQDFMKTQPEAR